VRSPGGASARRREGTPDHGRELGGHGASAPVHVQEIERSCWWRLGVGVNKSQMQVKGTPIYRHGLGLGFLSGPNGLGWAWPKT
jgi:hypothetical protein